MSFRFITKSIRTYLIDCPVAVVLIVAPFLLKLGKSSPVAPWLSVVTRVSLLLSAFTDHSTAFVGFIRASLQWVDRALGLISITVPSAFHVTGPDAGYSWVFAAAVLLTTSALNAPEVSAAQRTNLNGPAGGDRFVLADQKSKPNDRRCRCSVLGGKLRAERGTAAIGGMTACRAGYTSRRSR
ncbi:hypothetical protein ACIPUD_14335 [Bradyrhizobium sp. CAR08]